MLASMLTDNCAKRDAQHFNTGLGMLFDCLKFVVDSKIQVTPNLICEALSESGLDVAFVATHSNWSIHITIGVTLEWG